jgi:hypothetical protein
VTPPKAARDSLDAELDELYAAPPDAFVAARAAAAKRLREAGRRDEARELAAARKPTAGAALVNALARAEPAVVAAAIDAVEAARSAIEHGDGVREALERQRGAVDAAEAPLVALAADGGASAAVARQATETLRAAVLDPELQPLLRAGRLRTAGRASGFAALPATPAPRGAAAQPKAAARNTAPAEPVPRRDRQAEAAAAREMRRAAAELKRQLAAAQRDLQTAEHAEAAALRALAKAQAEAERSTAARSAAAERLAELERGAP